MAVGDDSVVDVHAPLAPEKRFENGFGRQTLKMMTVMVGGGLGRAAITCSASSAAVVVPLSVLPSAADLLLIPRRHGRRVPKAAVGVKGWRSSCKQKCGYLRKRIIDLQLK